MDIKFAFENVGGSLFGTVYRPIAKVFFKSLKNNIWISTWMVIDTGADFTILPRYLSEDLEVSLEKDCIKDTTTGVGGQQALYLCRKRIKAKLGAHERDIPLAFLDSNELPALLGRLGFLETFNTQFLKNHFVVFKS